MLMVNLLKENVFLCRNMDAHHESLFRINLYRQRLLCVLELKIAKNAQKCSEFVSGIPCGVLNTNLFSVRPLLKFALSTFKHTYFIKDP